MLFFVVNYKLLQKMIRWIIQLIQSQSYYKFFKKITMKKNILVVIALLITIITLASDAPKAVKEAFAKKFPIAKSVKWEKENAKEYEASFTLNGAKMSANFNNEGVWLETETEIKIAELPVAVSAAIKTKFTSWVVTSVSKIEAAKGIQFEADIKKGKEEKEILLNAEGTLIK